MASERKQRDTMRVALSDIDVHAEAVPLSFDIESGGRELRPSPLGYVADLKALIHHLLDENERYSVIIIIF